MIRVYVVDDEKLVRRGIIGLIDWAKYDMEVVGDSGSGEEALHFLREKGADILFSDLEMPGLSGIAFLQEVRQSFPRLQMVVLTMHQEFELIQQALRIGILDYITKAQIEEENVDAFMQGVHKRYLEVERHYQRRERKVETESVYVWELPDFSQAQAMARELEAQGFTFELLSETSFLFPGTMRSELLEGMAGRFDRERSTLLEIGQIARVPYDRLENVLQTTGKRRLFQDRRPGEHCYAYAFPELLREQEGCSREEVLQLSLEMAFMVRNEDYEKGMARIQTAALSAEERIAVFYHFDLHWADLSGKDISRYFEETGNFLWWYQWRGWFDEVRGLVLQSIEGTDAELATMEELHRAMNYIREHMDRDITLEELLRLTGMSKSHFSRKFKNLTGKTFVTYLNDLRIEAAKKYLTETRQPIYWIAKQVGYADERYFRRIFRERVGDNPKQFRENNQK